MPKYTDEQKQQWADQRQQQLEAITQQLEQGVADVFTSEKYMEYLKTVSKFPRYSTNNTLLISMQRPDASYVAGYEAWKHKFHRQVKKGEKGIKIFAPVPYKTKVERDKLDPHTGKAMQDENGKTITEEVEVSRAAFRVVSVFDYAQTEGEPIADLEPQLLTADVADYEQFLQALIQTAKIPVTFEPIDGTAKGYFNPLNNTIVVREGMPELQNIKTLIHEISHSRLDALKEDKKESKLAPTTRSTQEVRAESIAFVVSSHYGLDTGDYSFTYIAGWSDGKKTPELKAELTTIRETASLLIDEIDQNLYELEQAKETDMDIDEDFVEIEPDNGEISTDAPSTAAYSMDNGSYLSVGLTDDGWDFTLYDENLKAIDGGCYTAPETAEEAKAEALHGFGMENAKATPIEYDSFMAKADLVSRYDLTPLVLEYVDAEKGYFQIDTAVEPVVTVVNSQIPQLRIGTQLPLHMADKIFSQLEAEQIRTCHGKKLEKDCPKVEYQLRWHDGERNHVYSNNFFLGSGNGGLLLSMTRNANHKLFQMSRNPELGANGKEQHYRTLVEKTIPTFYQQSMTAENIIKKKILPPPVPFHNVSYEEAMRNPTIGRKNYIAGHRETVACCCDMNAGLETAYHQKSVYQFLDGLTRQYGADRVKAVLCATVQHKPHDGRFYQQTKDYASQMPLRMVGNDPTHDRTVEYVLNAHSVVVNGTIIAFRKMEQSRANDRKPSIRGRLRNSQKAKKEAPQTQEQTQRRKKQNEL